MGRETIRGGFVNIRVCGARARGHVFCECEFRKASCVWEGGGVDVGPAACRPADDVAR